MPVMALDGRLGQMVPGREVLDGHHLGRENLEIFEKPPDFFSSFKSRIGGWDRCKIILDGLSSSLDWGEDLWLFSQGAEYIGDWKNNVVFGAQIQRSSSGTEWVKSKPWWLEERVVWFLPFPTVDDRKLAKFIAKFILLFTIGFFLHILSDFYKNTTISARFHTILFRNSLFYPTSLGGGIPWSWLNLRTGMGSFAHGDGDRYIGQWRWIFFCVTQAESI